MPGRHGDMGYGNECYGCLVSNTNQRAWNVGYLEPYSALLQAKQPPLIR